MHLFHLQLPYNGFMKLPLAAFLIALASLAGAQQSIPSDDPDRFEVAIRAIEKATTDADAKSEYAKLKRLLNDVSKRDDELRKRFAPNWEAYRVEADKLWAPIQPFQEILWLEPQVTTDLIRSLGQSSHDQRISKLRVLAKDAREDFPLKDDETYFGPSCGTYDHTDEHKISWAVKRYPDEAFAALRIPAWNGRAYLMQSLQSVPDWQSRPGLFELLKTLSSDKNTLVRGAAIMMLAKFPGETTNAILKAAATNRAADTRAKALYTIVELKLIAMEPQVVALVNDPVNAVQTFAVDVLGKFATSSSKQTLIQLLQTKKDMRWQVLGALSESKCTEAAPYVHRLYQEDKSEYRAYTLTVLTELDPMTGGEEVERALSSPDEDLLITALGLAGDLKLERTRRLVQKLLAHKDEYVRSAAQRAIASLDGRDPNKGS